MLWVSVVPALTAVGLLAFAMREPQKRRSNSGVGEPFRLAGVRRLGRRYWMILILGATFAPARFSEAFLVLRAQSVGIAMNIVYAAAAYPAGAASDWASRHALLLMGLGTLVVADIVLALAVTRDPLARAARGRVVGFANRADAGVDAQARCRELS